MQHHASTSTTLLHTLIEIRLENRVHPGMIADAVGVTPSAWAKIESGQTALTLEVLGDACRALVVSPSFVMMLAERLALILNGHGWYFQNQRLGKDDELLPLVQSYFASTGYEALRSRPPEKVTVLSLQQPTPWPTPTIVSYCCMKDFRDWIDNGAAAGAMPQADGVSLLSLATTASVGTRVNP